MTQLIHFIETGFPKSRPELPPALREYHQFREHLYTVDGVILYKNRIVIPPSLRQHVLTVLHSAHQGVTSMTARAESTVFWPGITPAIIALPETCNHCNRMAPSQPSSPPSPVVPPAYPFQCVCTDFFHHKGVNYLVIVDRYSNWPIVERAREGSKGLIDCLRQTFATFGIPDELATDGGPEFTATTTRQFLKDWGIHHRLSSVAFPHSNCRAEIGVKSVKWIITDNIPQMVASTQTPYSVQFFSIETPPTRTPSCPLHNVSSAGRSRTSYLSYLGATNHTLPGVTLWLQERKP